MTPRVTFWVSFTVRAARAESTAVAAPRAAARFSFPGDGTRRCGVGAMIVFEANGYEVRDQEWDLFW